LLLGDNPQSEGLGIEFIGHFVVQLFSLMIVRMSRRTNSEAEVGPAAIAIAIIVGLLYIYLGGALHWGYGPTAPTGIQQVSK
jgi:uncharacterized membrane protein